MQAFSFLYSQHTYVVTCPSLPLEPALLETLAADQSIHFTWWLTDSCSLRALHMKPLPSISSHLLNAQMGCPNNSCIQLVCAIASAYYDVKYSMTLPSVMHVHFAIHVSNSFHHCVERALATWPTA